MHFSVFFSVGTTSPPPAKSSALKLAVIFLCLLIPTQVKILVSFNGDELTDGAS